jgi:hypothetical protein
MRYLKLAILILVYALTSPAFAGPQNNNCPPSPPPGGCTWTPNQPQSCPSWFPTKASQVDGVNKCVQDLAGSAIFVVCGFFEDDAGRAADKYTALTCADRQAALAAQCRSRCERYVSASNICKSRDQTWHDYFGDIGGNTVGSARVDLCGPPLKFKVGITKIGKVKVRRPLPPHI